VTDEHILYMTDIGTLELISITGTIDDNMRHTFFRLLASNISEIRRVLAGGSLSRSEALGLFVGESCLAELCEIEIAESGAGEPDMDDNDLHEDCEVSRGDSVCSGLDCCECEGVDCLQTQIDTDSL